MYYIVVIGVWCLVLDIEEFNWIVESFVYVYFIVIESGDLFIVFLGYDMF